MQNDFILASHDLSIIPKEYQKVADNSNFKVWTNGNYYSTDKLIVILDGYVMPRSFVLDKYKQYKDYKLIEKLYKDFNTNLIHKIKGFFNLLIIDQETAYLFNDRHSVKKFFIHSKNNTYIFSNNLSLITNNTNVEINDKIFAIQALFQHMIEGTTLFKEINYSQEASEYTIASSVKIKKYWSVLELAKLDRNKNSKDNIASKYTKLIKQYIDYYNPGKISLTLTGGRDTRTILSLLLSNNIKPHTFTFGFPTGNDVIASKKVVDACDLEFTNHYINTITVQKYQELVNSIVGWGNPNIHIHRAHRLDAIIKEKQVIGKIDLLFTGAMGGDYIKGVHYDDYIVSEYIRRYLFEDIDKKILIKNILDKHYINYNDKLIDYLFDFSKTIDFLNHPIEKERELLISYRLIGCVHDVQDTNVFLSHSEKVIVPFMDIDFLEVLFSSDHSLFSNYAASKNLYKKLKGGELQSYLIKKLTPKLSKVEFANLYTPSDVLGNKLKYFIKRIYLHLLKVKSNPTFSYDNWFVEFVNSNIIKLDKEIEPYYKFGELKKSLENNNHKTTEGYWHKFSNPIMFNAYLKQLKKN